MHRREHFAHGRLDPDNESAGHDGVADVELGKVRDLMDKRDVAVVDPVPGVDLKAKVGRAHGRFLQPLQLLALDLFRVSVSQRAGVQLDHFRFQFRGGIHLLRRGIDEKADPHPDGLQAFDRAGQVAPLPNEIEAAFGRDLFPLFRDETDLVGLETESKIEDLGRVAHLEVELRHDVGAESFQIAILHMATIGAQVRDNPARAGALAQARRRDRVGFGIFRVRHGRVACLSQSGDVIDINAEM